MVESRIAVVGAGTWGTVIASIAARSLPTTLWARRAQVVQDIQSRHENSAYLEGFALPDSLKATTDLSAAAAGAELLVMAVPSHGFRSVLAELAGSVPRGTPVLSLTKGIESASHLRMTQIVAELLPDSATGVLSGPNLAREIASGQPAATVVAMTDERVSAYIQDLLWTETFRLYTNPDVIGCEIAGAAKNVIAIAAGISDGLGFGDSSRAALVTRGLAEIGRLGVALGGDYVTFGGLAGVGDLVVTCTSPLSRNRWMGEQLGRGRSLGEILGTMHMVAEGVKTARPLLSLAGAHGLEMPIVEQVAAVLDGERTPLETISSLMGRSPKAEFLAAEAPT